MKKAYCKPVAEKVEFDYTDNVVASQGHLYQLYTDGYTGCKDTPTKYWSHGDMDSSCTWDLFEID